MDRLAYLLPPARGVLPFYMLIASRLPVPRLPPG